MNRSATYRFLLFVADDADNSLRAIANLTALCREYLPERYKIEIIDVFKEPERALAEGIFMTPTLIKTWPAPLRRIVGTLSNAPPLLQALGLETRAQIA